MTNFFFNASHFERYIEMKLAELLTINESIAGQLSKVETEVTKTQAIKHERFLACISSNDHIAKAVIRKTARLANYFHSKWYVLYVQTPNEHADKIALDKQRHLINNFKLATELGAEIIKIESTSISKTIVSQAIERNITTICIGKPHLNVFKIIWRTNLLNTLFKKLSSNNIDLIILS